MTFRIRELIETLVVPDIPDVRAPLKPLTFRLSSADRARVRHLSAVLGIDESKLIRGSIEILFHKHADLLSERFSPEAVLEEYEKRIDRLTLAEMTPELLALGPKDHRRTKSKIIDRFKRRVVEIVSQPGTASESMPTVTLSWGETPIEAAARINNLMSGEKE
jgi:hypothetical protein